MYIGWNEQSTLIDANAFEINKKAKKQKAKKTYIFFNIIIFPSEKQEFG